MLISHAEMYVSYGHCEQCGFEMVYITDLIYIVKIVWNTNNFRSVDIVERLDCNDENLVTS